MKKPTLTNQGAGDYLMAASVREAANRFVEWINNGGQRGHHASMLSAPLRSTHGQR